MPLTSLTRAGALPLTLLALGLVAVAFVAVLRPTPDRQVMVDRLGRAIRDLGAVIAGGADHRGKITGRRAG